MTFWKNFYFMLILSLPLKEISLFDHTGWGPFENIFFHFLEVKDLL